MIKIVPIATDHIDGFHRTLDFVARERHLWRHRRSNRRGLSFKTSSSKATPNSWRYRLARSCWCDALPKPRPIHAHVGVLGVGLLPPFRGQGIATAIGLYKKLGFVAEGVQRNAFKVDGQ